MKKRINSVNDKHLRAIGVVAISIVVSTMLIGSVTSYYLEKKTAQKLDSLHIERSLLDISLFHRSIEIHNLRWSSSADSTSGNASHEVFLKKASIQGINLFKLLFKKKISLNEILLEDGYIRYNESLKPEKGKKKKELKFKGITIDNLLLKNIETTLFTDTLVKAQAFVNLSLGSVEVNTSPLSDSIQFNTKSIDLLATNISFGKKTDPYSIRIKKIMYNSFDRQMLVDSTLLIPNYGKYEFARRLGRQETRVDAAIPTIRLEGFDAHHLMEKSFTASKVVVESAEIVAFRDKRLPFKNDRVALPMESLRKLAMAIETDSIIVKDMRVTVEEFAADGQAPGSVVFENLDAVFTGLSNRYYANRSRFASLYASGFLMGNGRIDAVFEFPVDGSSTYRAKGKIGRMDLQDLNNILENLGHIRIETGQLNEMTFAFDYTDKASAGVLQINYENLKMTSLNTDKEASRNEFKTLVINSVIKNSKDEKTDAEKRTGTIEFERDQQKFIFNFWWKSILSGIKSSVLGPRLQELQKRKKNK